MPKRYVLNPFLRQLITAIGKSNQSHMIQAVSNISSLVQKRSNTLQFLLILPKNDNFRVWKQSQHQTKDNRGRSRTKGCSWQTF